MCLYQLIFTPNLRQYPIKSRHTRNIHARLDESEKKEKKN